MTRWGLHYRNLHSGVFMAQKNSGIINLASTGKRLTPLQRKKKAIELTKTSVTDIFDFVANPEDNHYKEEVEIAKVVANPKLFAKRSFNQQESVIEALDHLKYEDWNKSTRGEKQLLYFISYGNWGPRSLFKEPTDANYVPEDLPFDGPGVVNAAKATKLPAKNLRLVTEERKKQYDQNIRKLDPISQGVVILAVLITGFAVLRDRFYAEVDDCGLGSTIDNIDEIESLQWIQDMEEKRLNEENVVHKVIHDNKGKKWYYLWLR